ncbi:unnamed protein product, partial [Mesorhabditis belari]|uniref:SH2 domain-containing protein n=1 Tax=Mesorhabditis belari TaxID=2138241 RepID=A0AAF3EBJ9_9BILA
MPSATILRRPSDLAHELIRTVAGKLGKNVHKKLFSTVPPRDERKCRSTGDLDDLDMLAEPTTSHLASPLPAHFDDCDRVPMEFGPNGGRLLPQTKSTRKMLVSGERRKSDTIPAYQLHYVQTWFYPECSVSKVASILQRHGMEDGTFIVHSWEGRLMIAVCDDRQILHIPIAISYRRGSPRFRIDLDKTFRSVVELVEYYSHHKGYVLARSLTHGIARNSCIDRSVDAILKEKRTSI